MNGIWILLLLVLVAALPAIIVYIWYRVKKYEVSLPWFLAAIAAGMVSLVAAGMIQRFFIPGGSGFSLLFFGIFSRIAFVEELSRLITLIPLLAVAGSRRLNVSLAFSTAIGLVSGLGFALLENAFHGTADINITLLRIITTAPLHGTCGIRAGAAIFLFRKDRPKALYNFIFAVLIHGTYNLIIINPTLPSALAIIVAYFALLTSLPYLKPGNTDSENTKISPDSNP